MSERRNGLSDTGWGVLVLLIFALIAFGGEGMLVLLLAAMCLGGWAHFTKTGHAPDFSKMISDFFTKDR